FLQIAAAEPERCAVIDAISSEDAVHRDVIACIKERLSIQLG
ncbi:MAG: thymidylate kinase, partial [Rhodospirillaceae bacterium]|nr:thymidylate kinase [Rhodospirillaceae bacterium]